jgi:nucleotide-binding universal stress UspA family protein
MQTLRKAEAEVTKSIGESFAKRVASAPPNGEAEFFSSEGEANVILARQARYHDILVMGQFTVPGDAGRHIRAEDLVLRTGRPIIVVPHSYEVREFQEYAVVGWDGSRQSARALSDAMQILETKKRLDIVTVRSAGDDRPAPDSSAVVRHLERHGVEAKHLALNAMREGVGQTLLNYCADNQPDVLVTGAYGHTKLREDLFGGVTRYIMENMTIPVLMSH